MPRKKSDPAGEILQFFRSQPLDVATLMFGLVTSEMKLRTPTVAKKVVKRRMAKAATPSTGASPIHADVVTTLTTPATPPVKRKRRTQAEITQGLPIVPLQATVGDDELNQTEIQ